MEPSNEFEQEAIPNAVVAQTLAHSLSENMVRRMALVWSYIKQINRFYRIEERDDQEKDKNKKRLVLFAHNEEDARLICMAVNKSGLTAEMFRKPVQQPIKKAS